MIIEEKLKKVLRQESKKRISLDITRIESVTKLAERLGYKNKGYNIAPLDSLKMERYLKR